MMKKMIEYLGITKNGIVEIFVDGQVYAFDSQPVSIADGGAVCLPFDDATQLRVSLLTEAYTGWEFDFLMSKNGNGDSVLDVEMTIFDANNNRTEKELCVKVDDAIEFLQALGDSVTDWKNCDRTIADVFDCWYGL